MKKARRSKLQLFITLIIMGLCATPIAAQTSAFNYQGKLTDAGNPATGQFDFQFKLFDTQSVGTGTQQGGDVNVANVTVTNGSFSVPLDFGACASCFNGAARFLEIAVKPTSSGTFTTLAPRQPITSTPYAIRSQNAAMATLADGLSVACVNCVTSSHIASVNGSVVSGTIPVASVPAGSSNYIQNTTTAQAGSDFNISGNGTAGGILSGNLVNAATQFNLGGSRILSAPWFGNLFAGINAGINITDGQQNSFFGYHAGQANTNGFYNSFFGSQAGSANTSGDGNSFFGNGAGFANTTGFDNAFFGYSAGQSNTTGLVNSFFGSRAGTANTTGGGNSFVGTAAGTRNTTGNHNTFIGVGADFATSNPTGDDNTLLGYNTHVNSGLSNATAIGANASVTQSNSLVLGNGVNVGIGTATPSTKLEIVDPVRQLRFGPTTADNGGYLISTVPHQAIIIGGAKFDGTNWIARDTVASMTAHQFGAIQFFTNDNLTVGSPYSPSARMTITTGGNVGIGTDAPGAKLHVTGGSSGDGVRGVSINGDGVRGDSTNYAGVSGYSINGSGVFGSSNYLAGYFQGNVYVTGTVTQGSDARLKQNISKLAYGLSEVLRLRPVTWRWKAHPESGEQLGLVAQEVEPVLPELVSTTKDAEQTKGLNYTGLLPVMIKAMQEQQARIEQQSRQLKKQQTQIARQQRDIGELRQAVKALQSSIRNHHRK